MLRAVGRVLIGTFLGSLVMAAIIAMIFLSSFGHAQTTSTTPASEPPVRYPLPVQMPSSPYNPTVLSTGRVTSNATAVPLAAYVVAVGNVSGRSVVPLNVPDTPVTVQVTSVPWGTFWQTLLKAYGLSYCELDGVLYVGSGDAITRACGLKPVASKAYKVKLTLFDLNTDTAKSLGGNIGQLASNVLAAVQSGTPLTLLTQDWSKVISALETANVGRRQDEITLNTVDGLETTYRNGGSLSVNLVSDGQKIEKSIGYGLNVRLTPFSLAEEMVDVHYDLDVSTPVSVTNPSLLQLASRNLVGVASLRVGQSVVVALGTSSRADAAGSGVPGAAALPVVGNLAGTGSSAGSRSVTLAVLGLE